MSLVRRQSGAVLMVALILLTILAMLGLSALHSATLEELIAGGQQDQALALAAAETALRDAEQWLGDPALVAPPVVGERCSGTPSCRGWVLPQSIQAGARTVPLWNPAGVGPARYRDLDAAWWREQGVPVAMPKGAGQDARFIVEELRVQAATESLVLESTTPLQYQYRITARGTGRRDSAVALVQVIYGRTF